MAYKANPFLERMSERTTSDQEFVRLFSPRVLDRLPEDAFQGAVHIFRSSPGGGKTTLLRAFTPSALRAFWSARASTETKESHQRLVDRGILNDSDGPTILGVLLSCASGYADLPAGASNAQEALFRALLDCRVVLRTIRSLALLVGLDGTSSEFEAIEIKYDADGLDLKHIPLEISPVRLVQWAEREERAVYKQLDSIVEVSTPVAPAHVRLESIIWLQAAKFHRRGKLLNLRPLLMIDDVHKLRRKQRAMLLEEIAELRPQFPVWVAERTIVLGEQLISQGVREGRDVREYPLEELWGAGRSQQFLSFAQNVLDRRLYLQEIVPPGASFAQYLRTSLPEESRAAVTQGSADLLRELGEHKDSDRYAQWLQLAAGKQSTPTLEALRELFATRILIARDQAKKQLSLGLGALSTEDHEERDSSQVQAAAEIFIHEDLGIPYYYGIERLCAMATNNIDELLALAAALYDGIAAKRVLRKTGLDLSPDEQERRLVGAAKRRRDFIPKNNTHGTKAQRLLDAIGSFCRDKTFVPSAPYAPGVTGVRLTQVELAKLTNVKGAVGERYATLKQVLSECVAENLLVARASAASTSRDSGTIFYLNRALCSCYALPLQMGGWQDVAADLLADWTESGRASHKNQRLEIS